jgi:hypothetical protein
MARPPLVSGLAPGAHVEMHGRGGQFVDVVLSHLWPPVAGRTPPMDRRTKLTPDEKALLPERSDEQGLSPL